MNNLTYFIYGLIQGITEFLPISSTAHLKIVSLFLGLDDPGSNLSAIVQLGSVLAIFFYFRTDLNKFIKKNKINFDDYLFSNKLLKSIIIGTIPIVFLGGFIKLTIPDFSESFLRSNTFIALMSIFTGILMLISDNKNNLKYSISYHSYLSSFFIGIGQAFAIFPGVSRSGITITISLLLGWKKEDSVRFSFLLGIPAIFLSSIFELTNGINNSLIASPFQILIGLASSFLTSLIALHFIIKFIKLNGLSLFVYYKIIFGIFLILLNY